MLDQENSWSACQMLGTLDRMGDPAGHSEPPKNETGPSNYDVRESLGVGDEFARESGEAAPHNRGQHKSYVEGKGTEKASHCASVASSEGRTGREP